MSSGQQAVSGLSILGIAFLLLGAIGIAATMQGWYQRVYDQEPEANWQKELLNPSAVAGESRGLRVG